MANQDRGDEKVAQHAKRASDLLSERKAGRSSSGAGMSGGLSAQAVRGDSDGADDTRSDAAHSTGSGKQAYPKSLGQFVMQNLIYILSVVAVVAVIGLVIVIVAPSSSDMANLEQAAESSYVSPYDWTKLDRVDGRYSYVVDGQAKSRLGIDVSENQREIDWSAVASDGIDFAMIRLGYRGATEGALYLDERYLENIEGARNAGLDCGIYFFSQARTVEEAVEEADYVLENLNGMSLEYPVAFDSEEHVSGVSTPRTTGVGHDDMTAVADAFCSRVEAAGYRTLVYGNAIDLSRYHREHLENHEIWWAEYGMPAPTAKLDFTIWQYSNNGSVAGVSAAVDMNIDLSGALS